MTAVEFLGLYTAEFVPCNMRITTETGWDNTGVNTMKSLQRYILQRYICKRWLKQHFEDCSVAVLFTISLVFTGFLSAVTMQYLLSLH